MKAKGSKSQGGQLCKSTRQAFSINGGYPHSYFAFTLRTRRDPHRQPIISHLRAQSRETVDEFSLLMKGIKNSEISLFNAENHALP